VFDYLNLIDERDYFGLLIEDITQDFVYQWLDTNKTLRKQLSINVPSVHLYFKVRFFPMNPSIELKNEYTKYLFVLQIHKSVSSGKLPCSKSTLSLLSSYLIQSKTHRTISHNHCLYRIQDELGDYDSTKHRTGYLADCQFVSYQHIDMENDIEQYHKQHR
jgi:hypothetical protein